MKKELDRKAKQQCAIKIQKVWKGAQQRKEYLEIKGNLDKVKKFRRIIEASHDQFKQSIIKGMVNSIKESKSNKDQVESEMLNNFLNVCALQIQSFWRGSKYRKAILPQLKVQRRSEEMFRAFVKGWQIRKVMQTREIFTMGQFIKDLTRVQEYFVYVEKTENRALLK